MLSHNIVRRISLAIASLCGFTRQAHRFVEKICQAVLHSAGERFTPKARDCVLEMFSVRDLSTSCSRFVFDLCLLFDFALIADACVIDPRKQSDCAAMRNRISSVELQIMLIHV